MKLCIEGDIYFIPKFHILKTGTVKLSIESGLIKQTPTEVCVARLMFGVGNCGRQPNIPLLKGIQ
jgi:hypothetical protein